MEITSRLHLFYASAKALMALVGGVYLIWRFTGDLVVTTNELAPTQIQMSVWKTLYKGQHWLSVTGRLADQLAAFLPNKDGKYATAYVPIVSENRQPGEPILAIAVIDGRSSMIADDLLERAKGDVTVTGCISPGGYNGKELFPDLALSPDVVWINENTKPDSVKVCIFLICLGVLFTGLSGYFFWTLFASMRRRSRSRPNR